MLVVLDKEVDNAAVRYTLNTLLGEFLRLDFKIVTELPADFNANKEVTLYYGYQKNSQQSYNLEIYSADLWSKKFYLKTKSLPKTPLPRYQDETLKVIIDSEDLPVIYTGITEKKEIFVKKTEKDIKTNIDVIASSFFMLSR
ncbi:MAG: hypothetical protein ACTSSH_13645, partial [Candidatus Heimdallarchaeota archaeon]